MSQKPSSRRVAMLILSGVFTVMLSTVMLSGCGGGGGGDRTRTASATSASAPTPINSGHLRLVRTPTPTPAPPRIFRPSRSSPPNPREHAASNFLPLINAGARYAGSSGGRGRVVAVIDGVDFSHPDLSGRQYEYRDANNPDDHGTPVAGTIAARRNGRGMHGVAYCSLVSLAATCLRSGAAQQNAD